MEEIVPKALALALAHHDGIFRKHSTPPPPYIDHPLRVANRFSELCLTANEKIVGTAASLCHDVLEDPDKDGNYYTFNRLVAALNYPVAFLVKELTNPSKGSTLPRAERKAMDREHISQISDTAKLIKLIDRTDNLNDLANAPRDFRELYLGESELLLDAIRSNCNHPSAAILTMEYQVALEKVRIGLS